MKIGLILSQTPGYSETFFNSKIKGLQEAGIEVVLFCQNKKEDFSLCPVILTPKVTSNTLLQLRHFIKEFFPLLPHLPRVVRYVELERKEGTGFLNILKKIYFNAHLLKAEVDWLHFGFATLALGSETVAKAIGAKMAVSFRGFDINVYPVKNPGCFKNLWVYVDKVHSISEYLLNKAKSIGLPAATPATIITPAVQIQNLPVLNYTKNTQHIKIVTIARLTYIKGLDIAIGAMYELKKKGIHFKYYIIGEGDKNYPERYKFIVYELGLKEEVIFCGKLSHRETLKHLSNADLYVQPSLNEGFCNAVLEAQALGKLTIASNVGGLPENILDGKTGWLFDGHSPKLLAQKIEMVLSLNGEAKKAISNTAQQRVRDEFNIEKQQWEFVGFYS